MHILNFSFPINCYPRVRLNWSPDNNNFLNQALTYVPSIAIWDNHKVPVALAIALWVVSIGFHVYSKVPFLRPFGRSSETHTNAF